MTTHRGIVLYGPPAAGKNVITEALVQLDGRYVPFLRLKAGFGRTSGYRMRTRQQLATLDHSDIVYRNDRYGATYVIDRPGLERAWATGMPIVHLGQVEGVRTLLSGFPAPWFTVLLWCSRDSAEERSIHRGDPNTAERMAAWDTTREDVLRAPLPWDLSIDTDLVSPSAAAHQIHSSALGLSELSQREV
ncbi:guanylate kinase [Streptomyces xiamenensis]|uniref:guanylate kinase n=1 Tax=Streptomyces xiamenensis TaxID=408015 RepID=UPI0035DFCE5A